MGSTRHRPDTSAFRRYVLLQLPAWVLAGLVLAGLRQWADVPGWVVGALLLVWVVKDFALYPWLRSSYAIDSRTPAEQQLVGVQAVTTQPLSPRGYVRLRGELWRAEAADAGRVIGPGTIVEVVAARGLTLVVREAPQSGSERGAGQAPGPAAP